MTQPNSHPMFRRAVLSMAVALTGACTYSDTVRISPEADRLAITDRINAGIDATRNKDIEAYMAQIPEGLNLHDAGGAPVTRDEIRNQVITAWEYIQETRYIDVVVDTIVVSGDSAVVHTTQTWDRLVMRPDTVTVDSLAVIDTVLSMTRQRELWRRTQDGWRAFEIVSLGGTTRINGVLMSRPPGM